MPKVGDVVLYSAFGRTVNAIVLKAGPTQPSHAGKNGEDSLTLLFIDPAREPGGSAMRIGPLTERPGYLPQAIIEHDVVHASHEFPAEYRKQKGLSTPAQLAAERGQGIWRRSREVISFDGALLEGASATNSEPQE